MKFLNEKTLLRVLGNSEATRSGYLFKGRANSKKELKRYFFSLRAGNVLCYYSSASSSEPHGVVFLEGHVVEMGEDYEDKPTLVLRFPAPLSKNSQKPLLLVADSPEELDAWMLELSKVGTDYLSLTLDGLEDQLDAINQTSSSNPGFKEGRRGVSRLRMNNTRQRDNPFETAPMDETEVWCPMEEDLSLLTMGFDALHDAVLAYWTQSRPPPPLPPKPNTVKDLIQF